MTAPLPVVFFNLPTSQFGRGPGGDTGSPRYGGTVSVTSPSSIGGMIDLLDLHNMVGVLNLVDSRDNWTDLVGSCRILNRTKYRNQVERYKVGAPGMTQALFDKIVDALRRRRIIIYVIDEPWIGIFCNSISKEDVNWMGGLFKEVFGPDCLTAIRVAPQETVTKSLLDPPPPGGWTNIDLCWLQYEGSKHVPLPNMAPGDWFRAQMAYATAVNLKVFLGFNWLDGGNYDCFDFLNTGDSNGRIAGTFTQPTPNPPVSPAEFVPCADGMQGNTRWYASPAQVQAVIDDIMADPDLYENTALIAIWCYPANSSLPASAKAAFTALAERSDSVSAWDYFINQANTRPSWNGWPIPKGVAVDPPPAVSVDLEVDIVSFNIGTGAAGTTVTVPHGLGEVPKVIRLIWSGRTGAIDAAGLGSYQRGAGWSIGGAAGQNYSITSVSAHNAAAGTANRGVRAGSNTACIFTLTTAGAVDGRAKVQSWDDTNIIFEILDPFAASIRVAMRILGGGAITDVAIGTALSPTGITVPSTTDVTSLPFTPAGDGQTLLEIMCAGDAAGFNELPITDSGFMLGAATSPSQQCVIYSGADDLGNPTAVRSYTYPGETVATTRTAVGSLQWRASFAAWLSNGFRWNHLEVTTAVPYAYLVINGPQAAILHALTSTSNGTDIAVTGAGFEPVTGMVLCAREAESVQDTTATGTGVSLGMFDATTQVAHAAEESNNVATSVVRTAVEHDEVYVGVNSSGSVVTKMARQSIDADGATFDMTDGDEGAYQFHTILLGHRLGLDLMPVVAGFSRLERGEICATAVQMGGFLQ